MIDRTVDASVAAWQSASIFSSRGSTCAIAHPIGIPPQCAQTIIG
jgi:hypothetical protein